MKLSQLDTEQINSNSLHIDEMTTEEILTVINQEDQKVAIAVKDVIPQIAKAVDCIYEKMLYSTCMNWKRLITVRYVSITYM